MKRETWKTWRDEEERRIALHQAEILMKMAEEEGGTALAYAKMKPVFQSIEGPASLTMVAECEEGLQRHRDRQSALENGARALGIILPD